MPSLMVLGTTSDAGKSTLVAGLGRLLARQKYSVAPFKPQNMALNSAVTQDGGEIGRAQALQAQACYLEPHTDMNPVLIKPSSDTQAQIIIQGTALANMDAVQFHGYKKVAMPAVLESFNRLQRQYHTVLVEGAGSPVEINLRSGDIANMGFAEEVDCPCILIADIDKGGVFAHIVGTLQLLSEREQRRIVGFVINRFRGDIKLLESGLQWLEETTKKPVLAVLPYLNNFYLDAEDAIPANAQSQGNKALNILVPVLPRISNHTDFDNLRLHPEVNLRFVDVQKPLPACDLVILPGSKNVLADLEYLRSHQWPEQLQRHLRYGGKLLGICGGFQMLGISIEDPEQVESNTAFCQGLGWIPMHTTMAKEKKLQRVQGQFLWSSQSVPMEGYEIHHGVSQFNAAVEHLIRFEDGRQEGYIHPDNTIAGSYCHGLFDTAEACQSLLQWCGIAPTVQIGLAEYRESQLNRLADVLAVEFSWSKLNHALTQSGFAAIT